MDPSFVHILHLPIRPLSRFPANLKAPAKSPECRASHLVHSVVRLHDAMCVSLEPVAVALWTRNAFHDLCPGLPSLPALMQVLRFSEGYEEPELLTIYRTSTQSEIKLTTLAMSLRNFLARSASVKKERVRLQSFLKGHWVKTQGKAHARRVYDVSIDLIVQHAGRAMQSI